MNVGWDEKLAWSIPIEFEGELFFVEYRKLGVGVFAFDPAAQEKRATAIVHLLQKGVKAARAYFEWLADRAVRESRLNVRNKSSCLYDRFQFFIGLYHERQREAIKRKDECDLKTQRLDDRTTLTIEHWPSIQLNEEAGWFALSAIEAFFSWTEHVFIHIALLSNRIRTGTDVADLARSDWAGKFKAALDITDPETKVFFDQLVRIRRELRNFVAHGSFGKQGEAFDFHSHAGAVPVLIPNEVGKGRFALSADQPFGEREVIEVIEQFVGHLWSGDREPAKIYIQHSDLPLILPYVNNGVYAVVMSSVRTMATFVDMMRSTIDRAADMDW